MWAVLGRSLSSLVAFMLPDDLMNLLLLSKLGRVSVCESEESTALRESVIVEQHSSSLAEDRTGIVR